MFDKAYLSLIADPQIENGNTRFSVNNGSSHRVFSGPNVYKTTAGQHTVIITSDNGQKWEVSAKVGYLEMLTIKLALSGAEVCDVAYKVSDAPAGIGFAAMKL